jgi:hypothetical protein
MLGSKANLTPYGDAAGIWRRDHIRWYRRFATRIGGPWPPYRGQLKPYWLVKPYWLLETC